MLATLGVFGLALGLFGSLLATGLWGVAAHRRHTGLTRVPAAAARQAGRLAFGGTALAVGVLVFALATCRFSLRYVAENASRSTSLPYRITALWSALDGSLLLWLLLLCGYGVVLGRRRPDPDPSVVRCLASATVSAVAASFLLVAVTATRPFQQLQPVPVDGAGPNPLLTDHPAMAIHPPLLYLGYVGLVVPFGYAVAGLVAGEAGASWIRSTRRWVLLAWMCLTAGIVLGAWWSYAVLGWGGYWAWDPVENASLMPWLTATALLHATLRARSAATSPRWLVVLAVASFLLVVAGTFLTRSGVVASVHSFTQSPLGPALLSVLVGWLAVAAGLLIWRADRLRQPNGPGRSGGAQRSSGRGQLLLINNVLLTGLTITVLVGTLVPVVTSALGPEISVGAPYYDRIAVPVGFLLLALIVLGTVSRWRAEPLAVVWRRAAGPAAAGAAVVAALGLAGARGVAAVLGLGLAAAVAAAAVAAIVALLRGGPTGTILRRRRLVGGHLAHLGLALVAAGIAASGSWSVATEVTLPVGGSVAVGAARAELTAIERRDPAGRMETAARLRLSRPGESGRQAEAALVYYPGRDQTVSVPAVVGDWRGDVYVTVLAISDDATSATVRLRDEPLVGWLWVGGVLLVAGGALSLSRVRRTRPQPSEVGVRDPVASEAAP